MDIFYRMDMPDTLVSDEGQKFEQAAMQRLAVLDNLLLGDFDEQGVYSINKNITDELIKMEKYVVEVFGEDFKQYLIESKIIIDKKIYFALKIDNKNVEFNIVEKIVYGSNLKDKAPYCNIRTTKLDSFELTKKDENLEETAFKKYNIFKPDVIESKSYKDFSADDVDGVFFTLGRKLMLLNKKQELANKDLVIEDIERELFLASTITLKKCGVYGKLVMKEYKKLFTDTEGFLDKTKPGYYKAMNQLLNTALSKNYSLETKLEQLKYNTLITAAKKEYQDRMFTHLPQPDQPKEKNKESVKGLHESVKPTAPKTQEKNAKKAQTPTENKPAPKKEPSIINKKVSETEKAKAPATNKDKAPSKTETPKSETPVFPHQAGVRSENAKKLYFGLVTENSKTSENEKANKVQRNQSVQSPIATGDLTRSDVTKGDIIVK